MKYALNLSDDGRVLSVTYELFAKEGMPLVDALPDGDVTDYRYVDGEFIYDPLPDPEPIEPEQTVEDRIAALEEENASLREQTSMLMDCILEMSEMVYA